MGRQELETQERVSQERVSQEKIIEAMATEEKVTKVMVTQKLKKRKIIFDCDNTMGIPGCDMDDGLCLLYLLEREDIELLSVSASFGNNETQVVYENTKKMLVERKREDIPL